MEKQSKRDWLQLNANESNKVPNALQSLDLSMFEFNRYPDSDASKLKQALVNALNTTRKFFEPECAYESVKPENLIIGTGSDEVLKLILETFLPVGGVVLAPSPTFSEYEKIATIVKGRYVEVAFESLVIDIDALIRCALKEKADVIFLANPSNPTGQLFTFAEIERLVSETNALIVVDEAYAEFCTITAIQLALTNPRVIVTRTLSKAYGMASLRLGFAVAQPKIITRMASLKLTYNISGLSEWLAIKALENSEDARRYSEQVIQLRGKVLWLLNQLPSLKIFKSAANFILIEIEDDIKRVTLRNRLTSSGVRVRSFEANGGRLSRCIRLTLTDENEFVMVYTFFKEIEKITEIQGVGGSYDR
jgi:histidinol-phosphate aminotransferase